MAEILCMTKNNVWEKYYIWQNIMNGKNIMYDKNIIGRLYMFSFATCVTEVFFIYK